MHSDTSVKSELDWEIVPKTADAASEIIDFVEQTYDGIYLNKGDEVKETLLKKHLEDGATTFAIRFRGILVGTMTLFEGPRMDFSMKRYSVHDSELDELGQVGSIEKVGDFATLRPKHVEELEKKLGCKIPDRKMSLFLMNLAFSHTLKRGIRFACINVRETHSSSYAKGFGFRQVGKPHTTVMTGASIPTTEVFMVLDFDEVRKWKQNPSDMSFMMKVVLRDPPPETHSIGNDS